MEMVKRNSSIAILLIFSLVIATVHALDATCNCPKTAAQSSYEDKLRRLRRNQAANAALVQKLASPPPAPVTPVSVPVPEVASTTPVPAVQSSGGNKWCVPKLGRKKTALMKIIVDGCKLPGIDCSPLDELHGACHHPNNPHKHASFVMNAIYRSKGKVDSACDFGGIGKITTEDPSHDTCVIPGN